EAVIRLAKLISINLKDNNIFPAKDIKSALKTLNRFSGKTAEDYGAIGWRLVEF
ncbi:MAG: hypothetical protein JWQ35_826, partial [Bacteriovoracaceae bacterium]|nr:hypothetical protein [Bacteriovoracaceae bacterium]